MTTICDSCEDRIRLAHQDECLKAVEAEIATRRADEHTMKLKYARGFVDALELVMKLFKDTK